MGRHERAGQVGRYLAADGLRWWTVPRRLVSVVRMRRWMVPVPATYLWAGLVGIGLGIGIDLVLGWPWWLVAAAFVATVAIFFLSTAFWPGGRNRTPLATELLRVASPDRARELDYRHVVERFKTAPFPLYGLPPSWDGPRFLAVWGDSWAAGGQPVCTVLGLAHGDPWARHAPQLRVEVESSPAPGNHRRHILTEELLLEARPHGAGDSSWSDPRPTFGERLEPEWATVVIRVDGRPLRFESLSEGTRWVAQATLGGRALILRGSRMPISSIELVQITDLEPYFEGERRRLEQMRAREVDQ